MKKTVNYLSLLVLAVQLSCQNQEQSDKFTETQSQDSRRDAQSSEPVSVDSAIQTIFSAIQGNWKLTQKYTASGKIIKTEGAILLTVRDSVVIKTSKNQVIWTDTLFRHFYYDSISEFYGKHDHKSGLRFDGRHPTKLSLLYGKGDLGGEDYVKVE